MPSLKACAKSPRISSPLYPALHRPEDRGWLQVRWRDTDTGREAKFYAITKKGRKQLETEVLGWEQLSNAVGLILRAAE
ncbi:MAG TPA: helix-turn-helix transcriptional regulator [Candidatus Limnocylindria bacterium]|jgi:DNA-binding PadR family transcriptional regulator|nr:helix-turn-helix transcriptional regulator [Candidatus Limnocylindria bacterium]